MKWLTSLWKRSKLWVVLGLGAGITALQFVFWRMATRKKKPIEAPKPIKNLIEKAEVEAIESRIRAESDGKRVLKRIAEAGKKERPQQIEDLGKILMQLTKR